MLRKLAGQTAVYGMSSIIGRFLNYLLTPLYTYQFVASDYGIVTEMYAYVAFFIVFLTFGMETAFFRFASKAEDQHKIYVTALMPVVLSSLAFMAVCTIFSGNIANAIAYPDHPEFITWFAIIVGLDAITAIPMARLRYENKAALFAGINLSSIAVNIGLNVFFIGYCKVQYDAGNINWFTENCYNPNIGVGYIFISNLAASIFKGLCLLPKLMAFRLRVDQKILKTMFIYSLPLLIAGIAGFTNENLDRLLLKYILLDDLGPEETMAQVGIYGACYKISILITLFIQAYRYATEPFFFLRSDQTDSREIYGTMMKYFVVVCLLIFLALMLNIDWVMLFVGQEYRIGVNIVPILLIANIFLGIYYNLSVWYKLTDNTIYGAYIAIAGGIITIVFNLLLIPFLGYMGSAWTTLICYMIMVVLSYVIGKKKYHIQYPIKELFGYAMLVGLVYYLMSRINWPGPGLKMVINNLVFLAVVVFFVIRLRPKKMIT